MMMIMCPLLLQEAGALFFNFQDLIQVRILPFGYYTFPCKLINSRELDTIATEDNTFLLIN